MHTDFRLGDWIVRPRRECIQRGVEVVHIQPKPMAVLKCLAAASGEVLTREELFETVWPDTFVTEDSLTQCVVELRKAFGDQARSPQIIKTIPKVGFCLVAPVVDLDEKQASIAVLPFVNMSSDPEQEYFSDGISEELINTLAKTPELRVISHTSAFVLKGRDIDVPTIARQLDVSHVLEGSVRKAEHQVRITVQLVEANTDTHLWSQSYDRDFTDIFEIQDDIARNVADKIEVSLLGVSRQAKPADPEAYRLYLMGRHHLNKYETHKAIEYFQEAIKLDPGHAQAHLSVAYCFAAMTFFGFIAPHQGYEKVRAEIALAQEIDKELPEAHREIAAMNCYFDWDWKSADEAFQRAISLVPNDAQSYQIYAWYLAAMGRVEEAHAMVVRALELEPLSPSIYLTASHVFYFSRQYDRAILQCQKALELNPGDPLVLSEIAWSYLQSGMHEEAVRVMQKSVKAAPDILQCLWMLGHAYAVSGEIERAQEVLAELHKLAATRYVVPYGFALIHSGLGEKQEALTWLERAYEERNGWMVYMNVEPRFRPLHPEPRFQSLLARMNFPAAKPAR